jgi:uncharacterized protein (TIGR02246 family)
MNQAEQEIKANMQTFADAWSEYDASKLASLFVEDADFVNVFGQRLTGKAEIETGHALAFANNLQNTQLQFLATDIKFIQPDLTISHSHWQLSKINSNETPKKGVLTCVSQYIDSQWKILAIHNTETRPLPFVVNEDN